MHLLRAVTVQKLAMYMCMVIQKKMVPTYNHITDPALTVPSGITIHVSTMVNAVAQLLRLLTPLQHQQLPPISLHTITQLLHPV